MSDAKRAELLAILKNSRSDLRARVAQRREAIERSRAQHADCPEMSRMLLVLRLTLHGSSPPVFREVAVPVTSTALTLHLVTQATMGWDADDLSEFYFVEIDGGSDTDGDGDGDSASGSHSDSHSDGEEDATERELHISLLACQLAHHLAHLVVDASPSVLEHLGGDMQRQLVHCRINVS